jgi:protein gp37
MLSDSHWRQPELWNRDAARAGVPARVFCGSMCDVFENRRDLDEPRQRLWNLIADTGWLTWMLLTKRPEHVAALVPPEWERSGWPANVWLGASAETQPYADERIALLAATSARTTFISAEPLLGPIDLRPWLGPGYAGARPAGELQSNREISRSTGRRIDSPAGQAMPAVDWVIAGGESGPRARPTELPWLISLQMQCQDAGVAFHLKQLGEPLAREWGLRSRAGRDPAEWPETVYGAFPQAFPREVPR